MKIEKGKQYKMRPDRGRGWNSQGCMDRYFNRAVTVIEVMPGRQEVYIKQDEDDYNYQWHFNFEDLLPLEGTILSNDYYRNRNKNKEE